MTTEQALERMYPGKQWTMHDSDPATLTFIDGSEPPTAAEINAFISQTQADDKTKRDAAIAHAKSLGFTDEMIAVMYPGLTV